MNPPEGAHASFRNGVGTILSARAVWVWLAGLAALQLAVEAAGGPEHLPAWYRSLGLSREGVAAGKLWQIASYGLLHGNLIHLAINCGLLLGIGAGIERMLGARALTLTMTAGIVAGGVFHLAFGDGLLVGASGGCVALLILLTTLSPQSRMFPLPVSARSLGVGILIAEGLMTLGQWLLDMPGLVSWRKALGDSGAGPWLQIGHACHFGGALCGWCLGRWILRPRVTLAKLQRDRARREARVR